MVNTVSLREIRAAGLTLADAARQSNMNYARLWRAASGGLLGGLDPDESRRLRQVLADNAARQQPA